jgi:hypothetical protein
MSTETMMLEVPTQLYTELTALAAEEQTDLVEILTRLVTTAHHQRFPSPTRVLRQRLGQTVAQPEIPALVTEMMQRSLHLSAEQWERLHQDLPSAAELGRTIGRSLTVNTHLSAEIVAMREA